MSQIDRGRLAKKALRSLEDDRQRRVLATLDKSAMRNLVAVAAAADSVDEVELVIRYQQARMKRWDKGAAKLLVELVRGAAEGLDGVEAVQACATQLGLLARAHLVIVESQQGKAGRGEGGRR